MSLPVSPSPLAFRQRRLAPAALAVLAALALAACSLTGNQPRSAKTIYAPTPEAAINPAWPQVDWQLVIAPPTAARMIDSFAIAVRPQPDELQVYRGASWARTPTDQLQDVLLRVLEDSGRIRAVARAGAGIAADYRLLLDVRRFEADYAGRAVPAATIVVHAKLVHRADQSVVGARTFSQVEPAGSTQVDQVVAAHARALGALGSDLAGWILQTGHAHAQALQTHDRQRPPPR